VGDPGTPVMLVLLAVPVCVLLFVVVLALMGGRWTAPAPLADPDLDLDRDLDLDPDLDLDRERVEKPAASGWGYETRPPEYALPAAPERALPAARPRAALPPARPQYGAYSHEPNERPEEDDASSRQVFPYGPYRYQ
jgi:hypothetical protein